MNMDYILVEGDLTRIKNFVGTIEEKYAITISKPPSTCLTMIRAHDSVECQEFYLGEALTTETEVIIDDMAGSGICLGDEPERAYCIAVIDALMQLNDDCYPFIRDFLTEEGKKIREKELKEQSQTLKTKVDFKLMEEA